MNKAIEWHTRVMYLLVALALVAGLAVMQGKQVAADPFFKAGFVADKTDMSLDDATVTFTNLTTGGKHPYTKAEWDFNADGVFDLTLTGSEANVMKSVTYTYNKGGIYNVILTMTDSTPSSSYVERLNYIRVAGPCGPFWNCPIGGQTLIAPYPGAGRPFLSVAAPCSGITVSEGAELWGIYYLDETTGTWLYYIPGFASSTLAQLEPGKYYYVVVSAACTLTIPQ